MDDDEARRLNTLHRFRKHSPDLVLETYSHCEVPAGCGGGVLVWRDPREGVPVVLAVSTQQADVQAYIDGRPLLGTTVPLLPGMHTFALRIVGLPAASTVFGCALGVRQGGGLPQRVHGGGFVAVRALNHRGDSLPPDSEEIPLTPFDGDLEATGRGRWRFERMVSDGVPLWWLPPRQAWVVAHVQIDEHGVVVP